MQTTLPTNLAFKWLLHLTGLHKQPELVIEIIRLGAAEEGRIFTPHLSQIGSWRRDISSHRARKMPDDVLRFFLKGLFTIRDSEAAKGSEIFYIKKDMLPLDDKSER